ncbi:MAG: ABC transporter permease subunit [Polyangiaceae bacterium]
MLRELARRLVVLPFILLAVTLAAFAALSSTTAQVGPRLHDAELKRELRALPRFVNVAPSDVRSRALDAVEALRSAENADANRTLEQLGGAALPVVLPLLDGLSREPRERVALALRPVAERMGVREIALAQDGAAASSLWIAFWEERALDFKPAAVRRAVDRYAENPTPVRRAEVLLLDTLALQTAFEQHLGTEGALASEGTNTRILPLIQHAARLAPSGESTEQDVILARQWWFAEASRYRVLDGGDRALATLLDTQYARWLSALVAVNVGFGPMSRSEALMLVIRGCWTVTMLSIGMLIAWCASIACAWAHAASRSARFGRITLVSLTLLTAVSAIAIASVTQATPLLTGSLLLGAILTLPLEQRATRAVRDELALPHCISAVAAGSSWSRVTARHGIPRALEALAAALPHDVALAISITFVIESLSGSHGLGQLVSRAVHEGDGPGMLGLALLGALWTAVAQAIADVIRWKLDPRHPHTGGAR